MSFWCMMNNPHRLLAHCLRMCWYASTAPKPLRPDKSIHGTHRISPELCVTRFDPAALSEILCFMQRPEQSCYYFCLQPNSLMIQRRLQNVGISFNSTPAAPDFIFWRFFPPSGLNIVGRSWCSHLLPVINLSASDQHRQLNLKMY